jgi:hypothetical protein
MMIIPIVYQLYQLFYPVVRIVFHRFCDSLPRGRSSCEGKKKPTFEGVLFGNHGTPIFVWHGTQYICVC